MGVEKTNLGNLKPEVPLRIFTSLLLSVYILMVQEKASRRNFRDALYDFKFKINLFFRPSAEMPSTEAVPGNREQRQHRFLQPTSDCLLPLRILPKSRYPYL